MVSISLMALSSWVLRAGILGIGIALGLSTISQFSLLLAFMVGKHQAIDLKLLAQSQGKIITATVLMGVALWVPLRLLDTWVFDTTRTLPLIVLTLVVGIIGGLTYFGLAYAFKIPELAAFSGLFSKLGRWRYAWSEADEVIETTSSAEEVKPW